MLVRLFNSRINFQGNSVLTPDNEKLLKNVINKFDEYELKSRREYTDKNGFIVNDLSQPRLSMSKRLKHSQVEFIKTVNPDNETLLKMVLKKGREIKEYIFNPDKLYSVIFKKDGKSKFISALNPEQKKKGFDNINKTVERYFKKLLKK